MKLLLCCTKAHPYLYKSLSQKGLYINEKFKLNGAMKGNELNSKIVIECDFEVEEIEAQFYVVDCEVIKEFETKTMLDIELYKRSCLFGSQIDEYLRGKNGYAIHIKNLHIFDEPKELSDVYKIENIGGMLLTKPFEKTPHNMTRVSVNKWDYSFYNPDDINILLPRSSKELCRILNGQQTIIVVKNVLKEMLK